MSYQGEPDLKTPSQLAQFHSTGGAIQATAEEKSAPLLQAWRSLHGTIQYWTDEQYMPTSAIITV